MRSSARSESIQYDHVRGRLSLLEVNGSAPEYTDLTTLIDVLAAGIVPDRLLPTVGIYALALAAHEHSGWPTESRRAALIQAVQQVRDACPGNAALDQALDAALRLADGALMRGDGDIEGKLVAFARAHSKE